MIPIRDENPTLRTPVVTIGLIVVLFLVWIFFQGAGLSHRALAASVCDLGLVPGEITGRAAVGTGVPIGPGMACIVDREAINVLTPLTSMFLHSGWLHLLGNCLYLWVFGNNIEDSMGRFRFLAFYLLCGLAAAAAQVLVSPASPVPMVGASGAISGVMGAYLLLYPRAPVKMLVLIVIIPLTFWVPAYLVLLFWIGLQLLSALPQLSAVRPEVATGVAFFAHIGGFFAGALLVKLFVNKDLMRERTMVERAPRLRRP